MPSTHGDRCTTVPLGHGLRPSYSRAQRATLMAVRFVRRIASEITGSVTKSTAPHHITR